MGRMSASQFTRTGRRRKRQFRLAWWGSSAPAFKTGNTGAQGYIRRWTKKNVAGFLPREVSLLPAEGGCSGQFTRTRDTHPVFFVSHKRMECRTFVCSHVFSKFYVCRKREGRNSWNIRSAAHFPRPVLVVLDGWYNFSFVRSDIKQ